MPNILETEGPVRKIMPIIYLIDTSGSMSGVKIAQVNKAMEEMHDTLKSVSEDNEEAEIKIAALTFSSGATWITNNLMKLEDFQWNDAQAGGMTDLGEALDKLDEKLSRQAFMKSDVGAMKPVIILMTDGAPNDDWEKALKNINNNKWYKIATKIGIAIGDDADKNTIAEVVGGIEGVIGVLDYDVLKKLIRAVSVTSSMISSKSRIVSDNDQTVQIIKEVQKDLGKDASKIQVNIAPDTKTDDSWDESGW